MLTKTRSSNRLTRRLALSGFAAVALLLAVGQTPANAADPLDAARNAGIVGERYDGYAVTRDGADGGTSQLVDQINAKRRAFYEDKASKEGVAVTAVQDIYAKTIYDKAPSGWWFLTKSGWSRK